MPALPNFIDPYLAHALEQAAEESATFLARGEPAADRVPMLVQVSDPAWSPAHVPGFEETSRITCVVAGRGGRDAVQALFQDPRVLRLEGSRDAGVAECAGSVPVVRADRAHAAPFEEKGDRCLVGIIDAGIDVLHQAFRDETRQQGRFLYVWDQRDNSGPTPEQALGKPFSPYGTLHTGAEINAAITAGARHAPKELGRDPNGHGTHVASIAVGRKAGDFAGGVAPAARIVAVVPQLRVDPGLRLSIGYSNSHVDALRFIRACAERARLPVAINISLGMNGGAHDGSTLLELACDELTQGGGLPGVVIVKSAGNEHGRGGHARLRMRSREQAWLEWSSSQARRREDVIEGWFRSCDDLRFRLHAPRGGVSSFVGRERAQDTGVFPGGNRWRMSFVRFSPDNGNSHLLVTVEPGTNAGGIEQADRARPWRLEIESGVVRQGTIDAWVERILSRPIAFTTHQNEETTLSIPATARTVIAVAAVGRKGEPFGVEGYSSRGPTQDGRQKPDVAAPGEEIMAARGGTDDGARPESGTSMAAPHVTGAIALALSRREKRRDREPGLKQLNAAQVRAALTQSVRAYDGNWTEGMGHGVLDVEQFLRELD
jgi:endonuclease G